MGFRPDDVDGDADAEELWTDEQLGALRAAAAATPVGAPNFWRRVARGVPGKSAAQCASRFQDTLAEQAKGTAPAAGAPKGGASKGRMPKAAAARRRAGDHPDGDESPGSEDEGRVGRALQAAVLGKRGRAAREHALRTAGREVRWNQRQADAGHADDAFELALGGRTCSSALKASLEAAAAATGVGHRTVPALVHASAPAPSRKDAKAHEAYVEQLLRRARPAVKKGAAPAAPSPGPAKKPGGGAKKPQDDVRAAIGARAPARTTAGQRGGDSEEEGEGHDEEDSGAEHDDYFSD
jgi:hypothetical protein